MLRNNLLYWIRKWGLMPLFDRFFFRFNQLRFSAANKRFRQEHPDFTLPPDYLLYEAYRLDAGAYYKDGRDTAAWVISKFNSSSVDTATILEWGCGPARIVRHLPALLPHAAIHACDYNHETIDWCTKN